MFENYPELEEVELVNVFPSRIAHPHLIWPERNVTLPRLRRMVLRGWLEETLELLYHVTLPMLLQMEILTESKI